MYRHACAAGAVPVRYTRRHGVLPTERGGREVVLNPEVLLEDGVPRVCRGAQESGKLPKHLLPQECQAFRLTQPRQCARQAQLREGEPWHNPHGTVEGVLGRLHREDSLSRHALRHLAARCTHAPTTGMKRIINFQCRKMIN